MSTISGHDLGRKLRIDRDMYFVFAINKTDKELLTNANEIASELRSVGNFFLYDQQSASRALEYNQVDSPALFYFNASLFRAAVKLPNSKEHFRTIVHQLIEESPTVVESINDFHKILDDFKFTLLVHKQNFESGKFIFFELLKRFGETRMIAPSNEIYSHFGLDKDSFILYRKEDQAFEYFDKTNISSVAIPKVRCFSESDVAQEEGIIVIATDESFRHETKEFLITLHRKFTGFVYGFMDYDMMDQSSVLLGIRLERKPTLFVGNFKYRYFYTPNGVDSSSIESVLSAISNGEMERHYLSESTEDTILEKRYVHRVVGNTYQQFINQERDVLMLFIDNECELQSVFEDFAHEFANIDVAFGVIDISKNFERFPALYGTPQVVLFPGRNKTDYQHLRGSQTRNNIMLLLEHYGSSQNWPFRGALPSRTEFEAELQNMSKVVSTLPQIDKNKHFKWMFKMSKMIDSNRKAQDEL